MSIDYMYMYELYIRLCKTKEAKTVMGACWQQPISQGQPPCSA
jgi:hypothetical protein